MHVQKALVPPKRIHWAKTCLMKEGGEVNEKHERFLPLDPHSAVLLSAKQKRGVAVESWKQWQEQCISLCMNICSIFWRNFFATQISREQHNQISTPPFMNRCWQRVSTPSEKNVPTCQIMHYTGVFKILSFHPLSTHQSLGVDGEG